ncbi:MAG TPA: cupin [Aquabacterium sp.]|nr:cupin [Aquabacterium sp.]
MRPTIPSPLFGNTIQASVMDSESLPWLPLTPHSPSIRIKHFRLDPVSGEMVSLIRAPAGAHMPRLQHAASTLVYTLEGQWKLAEYDWIAGPGSVVHIPAQTCYQLELMAGAHDTLTLHITSGDVHLIEDEPNQRSVLNWKTALGRYLAYCHAHCIAPLDLTAP